MYTGTIRFLRGIDRYGAQPPEGLPFRWAVLAWFENDGGFMDPWPLLRGALREVMAAVRADSAVAEYWQRLRKGILRRIQDVKVSEVSVETLLNRTDEDLVNEEFPSRIRFMCGDRVVLYEESEMWSHVGGPSPYHDSVTLSFFTARDISTDLEAIFTNLAHTMGVKILSRQE
jgi:hypothetical protein